MAQILRGSGPCGVEPHTGELVEPTGVGQPQFGERVDDQTLDVADVRRRPETVVDVDDRVADELAGTVVGDVAAALHRDEFRADRRRLAAQVGRQVGPAAVGEHVRMFEQQQMLSAAVLEQGRLDRERLAVRHSAQPADPSGSDTEGSVTAAGELVRVRSTSPSSRGSP